MYLKLHFLNLNTSTAFVTCTVLQVYLLMCRVSFPENDVFERVLPVLNVALASLHPLTDEQMFRALNAGSVKGELEWKDFQQRLDSLAGFMVRLSMQPHRKIHNNLGCCLD